MPKHTSLRNYRAERKSPVRNASPIIHHLFALVDESAKTYTEIGRKAGYYPEYLHRVKNGKNSPILSNIENIGQVLGYHLEWVKDD